ncbi:MAG: hypothetical protein WC342_07995 [Methanoregula sp.]|jgi:hypothetical protein
MVCAECAVLAQYTLAPDGFGSNATISANTTHASPTQTLTKKPVAGTTTAVKTTAKATITPTKTATKTVTKTPTKAATTKVTPTPVVYTTTQVNKLFLEAAFDQNTPTIAKLTSSSAKIAITGSYTDSDIAAISNFEQLFNTHSTTLTLPSAPVENNQGYIVINYLPETSLESLTKDTNYNNINTKQIINRESGGDIGSIYRTTGYYSTNTNYIYLNSDLTDATRSHYAIRGILYNLGFPGETGSYKDSIFYSEPNLNVNLSTIDWKAVEVMYGTKIKNGMSMATVKSLVNT